MLILNVNQSPVLRKELLNQLFLLVFFTITKGYDSKSLNVKTFLKSWSHSIKKVLKYTKQSQDTRGPLIVGGSLLYMMHIHIGGYTQILVTGAIIKCMISNQDCNQQLTFNYTLRLRLSCGLKSRAVT